MTIMRFIPVIVFSLTAVSLLTYHGIEFVHSFSDYFKSK
ncbi:hypothetical protein J2S19_001193 [Metabacillus malikii]|uniref:Uncharacterized protein n=1 Tax=Metabacillus malikii TaxID=1504265 RepID=A0ABT9ZDP2_9BACI|nr:hypothetical protein [Metabacillus malikii]